MIKLIQLICVSIIVMSIIGVLAWFSTIVLIGVGVLITCGILWMTVIEPIIYKFKRKKYLTKLW